MATLADTILDTNATAHANNVLLTDIQAKVAALPSSGGSAVDLAPVLAAVAAVQADTTAIKGDLTATPPVV